MGTCPQGRCGGSRSLCLFRPSTLLKVCWDSLVESSSPPLPLLHRKAGGHLPKAVHRSRPWTGRAQTLAATPVLPSTPSVPISAQHRPSRQSHLAIPATAPLDLWPQILQLASVTKNLVPMSGRVLVLQSDVHLLRCLIPWLSESLESCVLLGFVSLVPTIVDTMVVPNKHLWNASLSKHMND